MNNSTQIAELPNGIRIIHMQKDTNVSYCGVGINVGTRDELPEENGMAHFVEHMLFKGTTKRKSHHIINRLEAVGGELNAYTTKEETFVYGITLQEDENRTIELLSDIIFHSTFPNREIEKEKEVILDEINSYNDSPGELIFDDYEALMFKNNPLGMNILGEESNVLSFNEEMCKYFCLKNYSFDRIIYFYLGRTDFKKVYKAIERHTQNNSTNPSNIQRVTPEITTCERKVISRDTFQSHIIIGGKSLSHYDDFRTELFLLNNLLGVTGMNSRLNLALREKKGLVYNVESSLTPYSDCGIFTIYYGCDPKNVQRCEDIVYKELQKICTTKLTASQLRGLKKQTIGQLQINNENNENVALALGKSLLVHNRYETSEEVFKKIEQITAESLLEIANKIYSRDNLSVLIYQ